MTAPRALFAGPGAVRTLIAGRRGVVEHALSRGAYLRFGREWALLAESSAPFGPLSVTVTGVHFDELAEAPVHVGNGRLVIGRHEISTERLRRRASSWPGERASTITDATVATAALACLPEPPQSLRSGIDALATGRIDESVRALAGLGEGLTPAGDDVLTGAAAALFWFADGSAHGISTLAEGRASPLGLAYLRCAERGELPDGGAELMSAIRQGSAPAVCAALKTVRAWGASSGTALAWGICVAVIATSNTRARSV